MTVTPGPIGIPLCGTVMTFGTAPTAFLAELLDVQGIGVMRKAIDGTTENSVNKWGTIILSCIKRLKPFRATIAFSPSLDIKTAIALALNTLTITWPVESGYTTATTWAFLAAITDYTVGGQLEERVTATVEINPSGELTVVAATT